MSLRCWLGRHAPPIYDRAKDGTRIWRCPRCQRIRPRDVELRGDPIQVGASNRDPRFAMPAREQWAARYSAIRALRGVEQRRRGASVALFRRRA
ncbi:MAG: hypothetical protein AB7Q16_22960 [Vicinamibacterales bacterium]